MDEAIGGDSCGGVLPWEGKHDIIVYEHAIADEICLVDAYGEKT